MYANLSSTQRFMGLEENSREVRIYGALSEEELKRKRAIANIPNIELIHSKRDSH